MLKYNTSHYPSSPKPLVLFLSVLFCNTVYIQYTSKQEYWNWKYSIYSTPIVHFNRTTPMISMYTFNFEEFPVCCGSWSKALPSSASNSRWWVVFHIKGLCRSRLEQNVEIFILTLGHLRPKSCTWKNIFDSFGFISASATHLRSCDLPHQKQYSQWSWDVQQGC